MFRAVDKFPKAARLSCIEQSFPKSVRDGLSRDVDSMRNRENIYYRTLNCRYRYSLVLADFQRCEVCPVNRDPFRVFPAKPGGLWNGEMHLRRIHV